MQSRELEIGGLDEPVDLGLDIPVTDDFCQPVDHPDKIVSTFGPRWKKSESRFDFHRGIDFYGQPGAPIYAIGAGTVFRIFPEGSPVYPVGGNTLIVCYPLSRHFPWENGATVTQIFGVYLHLAEILVSEGEGLNRGQTIAAMGNSGQTEFTHLHFETRLQTNCSLEFQRRHPEKSCARYGFDPHVHPFTFIGPRPTAEISLGHEPGAPFRIHCWTSRKAACINRIETGAGVLDFNRRAGIDANTTAALDHFDYGWVKLIPEYFGGRTSTIDYHLEFPASPGYVQVTDAFGQGVRRMLD